jgi:Phage integrase family
MFHPKGAALRACCSTCVCSDPEAGRPKTVADLIAALKYTQSRRNTQRSKKDYAHLGKLISVARRCAECLKKQPQDVMLDDIIEIDEALIEYAEGLGLPRQNAVDHACSKWKLLRHAHQTGWTSSLYERHMAWDAVRDALGKETQGCGTIIKLGLDAEKDPWDFGEEDFDSWRAMMEGCGRSPLTIENTERTFRSKIRKAKLEWLLPLLDCESRLPSRYASEEDDLPFHIRLSLDELEHFKTDEHVARRDAGERTGCRTPETIRIAVRQIHGYATKHLGICGIQTLRQLLTKEIVCGFIDWLRHERKRGASGIRSLLGSLCHLTSVHRLFRGADFTWFRPKLRSLGKDPRWEIDERKNAKCVSYEEFAEVPRKLGELIRNSAGLNPIEEAWLVHDHLYCSWLLHLPWRHCSMRACGIQSPAPINLFEAPLTLKARNDPDLEQWAKRTYDRDPSHKFLQYSFNESEAKGRSAIWGLVPRELVALHRRYKRHRALLVDTEDDPGTVFVNREGHAMGVDDSYNLITGLTHKYLRFAIRPHLTRDIFAEHFLANGGRARRLQRLLWHTSIMTTWRYCRRFNAAHGAVLLDRHHTQNGRQIAI